MSANNKLIGHHETFHELIHLFKKNILPNKILLSGQNGIGKNLLAEHFINYIYSNNEDHKYNLYNFEINNLNRTNILYKNNSHPNVFKILKKKDKKNIEISQIREMLQFQNKSSFDNNLRTIVINDTQYLNLNSSNALLKSIEEPNDNLLFILINNNEINLHETIKSRCIEFKLILNNEQKKMIVNNYFNNDIVDTLPPDLINFYYSPSFIISLINFMNDVEFDYKDSTIEDLILFIIKNKYYSNNSFIFDNLNIFIELFFYKNIKLTKKVSHIVREYFYLKLYKIIKYNLDLETFFIEFEDKLLSE